MFQEKTFIALTLRLLNAIKGLERKYGTDGGHGPGEPSVEDAAARHQTSTRWTLKGNAGGRRHINYADKHVVLRRRVIPGVFFSLTSE